MTDDLVTRYRLREGDIEPSPFGLYVRHDDHAARIEADAATIARLEGERDAIERLYMSECEAYCEAHEAMLAADDARIAAEAMVAALVEALESIERETQNVTPELMNQQMALHSAASVARAAIAVAKGK